MSDPQIVFHHVGIGTTTFEGTIAAYRKLGYEMVVSVDDPGLDVRVAFLSAIGSPWIEVVAPLRSGGPLKSFIERKLLPAPYHTCYATQNMETAQQWFKSLGFLMVQAPTPAAAFAGARIAYGYHAALGLIELVENPPEWPEPAAVAATARSK
jgi:methylmalonyl-CoA/ethylmalonyl-CoA epimerase